MCLREVPNPAGYVNPQVAVGMKAVLADWGQLLHDYDEASEGFIRRRCAADCPTAVGK